MLRPAVRVLPMSSPDREALLLERATSGDDASLSELLTAHHDRLVREIAARLPAGLRGAVAPDDIAQETYVVAFRRIRDFHLTPGATFFDWLAGIAANTLRAAERNRRAKKRGGGGVNVAAEAAAEASTVNLLELLARHSRTPSRSMAGVEAIRAVQSALARVPEANRTALKLRYIEGLPVAEIAARMGRTEGAVHQLCHRGLRALGAELGDAARFFSRGA